MKKLFTLTIACLGFISCTNHSSSSESSSPTVDADSKFETYKATFIEGLWKLYPDMAAEKGFHRYDSVLTIADKETCEAQLRFLNASLDSLKAYKTADLSANNKTDYYIIENKINTLKWKVEEEKVLEWNPSKYNVSERFSEILNGSYDSLDTRLHHFYLKMKHIPAYFEAAKMNIKNPTLEHTQLAIDQNLGGLSVFQEELQKALEQSHLGKAEKEEITAQAKQSVITIKGFAEWLKKMDNKTPRSFRLGKELYAKKFELDIASAYNVDQVFEKAVAHKKDLHEKMFILADRLWNKYLPGVAKPSDKLALTRQVIDKISLHHVKPDSFQLAIERQLPVLIDFIKKKDLLYIDPSKPLVVRKEPGYMAGVAGVSVTSPGPYDKNANTYYNVGSLEGWSKEKAESYLREYNDYTLQILNIHEAIPGHYTQLVYSNLSPSLIKSLFESNSMIEGWAVYTERMMLENGYGNQEDEMWLMYYKWNLRTTCNMILDYSVHTKDMSKEEAMNLLMNEGFQQQQEAEGKWKRVTVSQVQLCCYFTGYTEIYELREELKKRDGDKFNLKSFHEKFLSYGCAPVKCIRELMLVDAKAV